MNEEGKQSQMAWISVHDTINGPKLRDLCSRLRCAPAFAKGVLDALWLWGLNNADKYGLILNADEYDVEMLMTSEIDNRRADKEIADAICIELIDRGYCDDDSRADATKIIMQTIQEFRASPEEVVSALVDCGYIDKNAGKLYLHDWDVWQKDWYAYKERRQKDAERKRRTASADDQSTDDESSEAEQDKPEQGNKARGRTEYTADFVKFWDVYPRRKDKQLAYEKFAARLKDGFSAEEMIKAAEAYAAECHRNHTAEQYIKHPKVFIGPHLCFLEYLPKDERQKKSNETGNPYDDWVED